MGAPRVLLTGANGYIGSHILNLLLERSVFVQAVVRSKEKALGIARDFPTATNDQLEFSIVPDMTAPDAFESCLRDSQPLQAIIHTASPVSNASRPSDYIEPAVQGTLQMLEATRKHGPTVKRFVCTGSIQAVVDHLDLHGHKGPYTSESWNPVTREQAESGTMALAYSAGKTYAERAAWEYMDTQKPHFELVVLNPPGVFGPHRNHIDSLDALNPSNHWLYTTLMTPGKTTDMPKDDMHITVDVRDLALAHLQAAFAPGIGNRRYLVAQGSNPNQKICDLLRRELPAEWDAKIPLGTPGDYNLAPGTCTFEVDSAREMLGMTYRPFEQTFVDTSKYIVGLQQAKERAKGASS